MITTILWDNDGVLVDTEELYFRSTQRALAEVGIPFGKEEYHDLFLVRSSGLAYLLTTHGYTADRVETLRERRNAIYSEMVSGAPRVMRGVEDVLSRLHGKYRMGIVTSSRKDHFDLIHANSGLLKYFDFVVTASDFAHSKPHPEPYQKALVRSGARADECVAVEDSERGLTSATAAGIRCFVIPTPISALGNFSAAARVLERIEQVVEVLQIVPTTSTDAVDP